MSVFLKGILSNFLSKSIVAFIGLLTVILVSQYLGTEGRGQISLFMSSVALLQLFCDFGNSSAIINLSYRHSKRVLWISSVAWIVLICLASGPVLFYVKDLPFKWLIPPAALLFSLVNLHHLILMGNQDVHKRNMSLLIVPILLMSGFFVLCQTIYKAEIFYILALFIALIIAVIVSYSFVKKLLKRNDEPFLFETEILKQGFWVQSAQALQFLNYRLNFFMVSFFIGNAALGIYNNAVILCESLWILGHSIAQMQHMKILNTVGESNHFKITHKMTAYNFYGTVLLFAILSALPTVFWLKLFGEGFSQIRPLFIELSFGVIAFSVTNIINHSLHAADRFKTILLCNGIGLVLGSTSAFVLIPKYGLEGAAMSWSIGLTASMIAYLATYIYINRFIHIWKIYRIAFIVGLFAAILSVVLSKHYMHYQMKGLLDSPITRYPILITCFIISLFGVYFPTTVILKRIRN